MKSTLLHFIGIGGCGMNGVAHLAKCAGYSVSGSDRAESLEIFQTLEKLEITIVPQDGSGITEETDVVVYSTAIENDNPDLVRARELDLPILHRAEMLAKLCEGKQVIAVAGTAGKSTVTGLLGHIFQTLELDPTVYCGAPVLNWKTPSPLVGQASLYSESLCSQNEPEITRSRIREACPTTGNVRFGKSNRWIIEADESDKSFLHFHPDHAIITNIAEDHFSISELRKLFAQFKSQVSGTVIQQPESFNAPSPLLGKHNIENVNNALTLCKSLNLDMHKCIAAVASFKGIERRLERVGPNVIDDFAHSPIKITAALKAVSGEFETFNVVWRPHGYTPLFQGLEGFIDAFSNHWKTHSGTLFILPVYYAGGTVEKKITSEQFVEKLQAAGVPAEFSVSFQSLEETLLKDALPALVMGARDPELPKFSRRLASSLCKV